jgi:hypothetical protein
MHVRKIAVCKLMKEEQNYRKNRKRPLLMGSQTGDFNSMQAAVFEFHIFARHETGKRKSHAEIIDKELIPLSIFVLCITAGYPIVSEKSNWELP